jgi:hypothetical protein
MRQDWTNLATFGRPAAQWPRFSSAREQTMSLVPPDPRIETDYAAEHHCGFWSAVAADGKQDCPQGSGWFYQAMACWPEMPLLEGLGKPGRLTI